MAHSFRGIWEMTCCGSQFSRDMGDDVHKKGNTRYHRIMN